MKFIEKPLGLFIDRKIEESNLESVDVVILTLDAENFLEKCLFSIYQEIPVKNLHVCDGGSKDNTIKILERFPRVNIHQRADLHTTGKSLEFLFSLVETEWFVLIDGDIFLANGWYDEMIKHQNDLDVIENSKTILAYHMYRDFEDKLKENARSSDLCHIVKTKAVKNYHCDDDYMWRFTDYFFRQSVEESGYRYGKIKSTYHIHNETERIQYESDDEKNFQKVIWNKPEYIITNKKKAERAEEKHAKAVVKYLDPENPAVKDNKNLGKIICVLSRKWVEENGPRWIPIYDNQSRVNVGINILRKFLKKY
ncbi:glycosyltransferase family 2 protein [Nitrosopumilus sp. S4]